MARRFEERRSFLAHILMYLDSGILNKNITEKDVLRETEKLIRRLYEFNQDESSLIEDDSESGGIDMQTELDNFLASKPESKERLTDFQKILKTELAAFKSNGQKGRFLEYAFEMIQSVKVSSVDVERVFSSVGIMVTKFRSRLSDETADSYHFLKHFFRNFELYEEFSDLE